MPRVRLGLLGVLPGRPPARAAGRTAAHRRSSQGTDESAKAAFLAHPKVARWMERYPRPSSIATARFRPRLDVWQVSVFSGKAGQIASGKVDTSGRVVEAWVGPEVAWPLARGDGIGGVLNRPLIWPSLCLVFIVGLANSPQTSEHSQPRPAGLPVVLGLPLVVQRRAGVCERRCCSDSTRVPDRSMRVDRLRQSRAPAGLAAARLAFGAGDGAPPRRPCGAEHRAIERSRRGLRRCDRRRPPCERDHAVRQLPRQEHRSALRPGQRGRRYRRLDPVERTLRISESPRGTPMDR